jgi:predicted adenine nucleotide alpha hydrolase (AANH) superfamily ATPase
MNLFALVELDLAKTLVHMCCEVQSQSIVRVMHDM